MKTLVIRQSEIGDILENVIIEHYGVDKIKTITGVELKITDDGEVLAVVELELTDPSIFISQSDLHLLKTIKTNTVNLITDNFIPNPSHYVDALQDPIHVELGKSRAAKSVKVKVKSSGCDVPRTPDLDH